MKRLILFFILCNLYSVNLAQDCILDSICTEMSRKKMYELFGEPDSISLEIHEFQQFKFKHRNMLGCGTGSYSDSYYRKKKGKDKEWTYHYNKHLFTISTTEKKRKLKNSYLESNNWELLCKIFRMDSTLEHTQKHFINHLEKNDIEPDDFSRKSLMLVNGYIIKFDDNENLIFLVKFFHEKGKLTFSPSYLNG